MRIPLSAPSVRHVLLENMETEDGTLLLKAGSEISAALLERVQNFARLHAVKEPVVMSRLLPESLPAGA